MGMKLITGGSGVLGRALIKKLLERGEKVRVYDLKKPPISHPDVEFFQGDIRDREKLEEAVEGCDIVFHLAAKMPQARLTEEGFYDINVRGTINVAEACLKKSVKKLIFASTTEMYGPQKITEPLDEEAPKLFTGPYSRNKFECEKILADYMRRGLEFVSLRLPMILGPGFYHEKSILTVIELIRRGLPIFITSPDMTVSFVSSDDAADAFILAAEKDEARGMAFNIAAPDYPPLKKFFEDFIREVGSKSKVVVLPYGVFKLFLDLAKCLGALMGNKFFYTPVELMDFALYGGAYSIERARKILGYSPKHTCLQAWLILYNWYFNLKISERLRVFFIERV